MGVTALKAECPLPQLAFCRPALCIRDCVPRMPEIFEDGLGPRGHRVGFNGFFRHLKSPPVWKSEGLDSTDTPRNERMPARKSRPGTSFDLVQSYGLGRTLVQGATGRVCRPSLACRVVSCASYPCHPGGSSPLQLRPVGIY